MAAIPTTEQTSTPGYRNGNTHRLVSADLEQITIDITAAPAELREETIRHCGSLARDMVSSGVAEQSEVSDAIWQGLVNCGFVAERGNDAAQEMLGFVIPRQENDEAGDDEETHPELDVPAWPQLAPVAKRGLAGELAKAATTHSEADPVAITLTALTSAGALMGRSRFIRVGDTEHHARLMTGLVGQTSRARKGTSWAPVKRVLQRAEADIRAKSTLPHPLGLPLRVTHGPLSSGEGLIAAIRDATGEDDEGGTDDKRLLVVEGELGAALRAMQRHGNTLSMILRTAWDGHELAPVVKRDRIIATDPHICVVAHVTAHELRELLNGSDFWGGLVNRLLWACVRRPKVVASPRALTEQDLSRLGAELARVAIHAHEHPAELRMTNSAADHWAQVYPELTQDRPGLLGAATARAEAQALRLALTYALLDGSDRIEADHLEAGLAMWRYADDSARYLFGEADPVARAILEAITPGRSLTRTQISGLFSRHQPKERIDSVLGELKERGQLASAVQRTRGRSREIWSRPT